MKGISFLLLSLFIFHFSVFSQTGSITNIQVSQRTDGSGLVDIYYDLSGPGSSYYISLEISLNNGSTFTSVSNTYVSGNTGITPGTNRHLIWNAKGSQNNTYNTQTKVKLIANTPAPCGSPITDPRDGKTYNTVQIGTQCWMAENLNIGSRINGSQNQSNNGIIEKYCYNDLESNCNIYGGLYQWNEAMQYVTTAGTQGICPPGWHLPTDAEWKILEGTVDTQYGVGDPEWDDTGWRGFDVGTHLKSTTGWYNNGNGDNSSGFTALPGGYRYSNGAFDRLTYYAYFWSSSEYSSTLAWYRNLYYDLASVSRHGYYKTYGFSARCLQD